MDHIPVLVDAGLPTPACHLLSNYYNRTRQRYYQVLAETSRPPYPVERFVSYALVGFVEELREQLNIIRQQQFSVAWINYVHEVHHRSSSPTTARQRELVLSLPAGRYTATSTIRRLTPMLAELYAGKQQKTVTRDLNVLETAGLIEWTDAGVRPRVETMAAFLPLRQIDRSTGRRGRRPCRRCHRTDAATHGTRRAAVRPTRPRRHARQLPQYPARAWRVSARHIRGIRDRGTKRKVKIG